MKMEFVAVDALPPLAWCAAHDAGHAEIVVRHGAGVEVRDNAFVEGAWAGSFDDFRFQDSFLSGSGGRVVEDRAIFVSPSHTFERLIAHCSQGRMLLSNSLALALAAADDALDPAFVHYRNHFQSAIRDPASGVRTVPTRRGATITSFYREIVTLGVNGIESATTVPDTPPFHSYAEYRDYLVRGAAALFENAADPARRRRYEPIASVSSGYDSGACAAISRSAGCRDAITLWRPDRSGALMDHGGRTIEALGLRMHEADRGSYYSSDSGIESIFLAAGFGAEDLTLAGFAGHVAGRVLITGVHGDQVWSLDPKKIRPGICRPSSSAASLAEFRLRQDFVHLPLAIMGATAARSIQEISRSAEMRPWSVGGSYDRPIARRILEEAGVPRGAFAERKRGYIAKLDPSNNGRSYTHASVVPLSAGTQAAFDEYCARHLGFRHRWAELRARPLRRLERQWRAREGQRNARARVVRAATRLLFGAPPAHVLSIPYGRASLLPLWGIEVVTGEYRNMLGHGRQDTDTAAARTAQPAAPPVAAATGPTT